MKLTPADTYFSHCVRERASWCCEKCGKYYAPPTKGLQCAHFVTRGNWATRFLPMNAYALCSSCHFYMDGNPYIFTQWVERKLGPDLFGILMEKSNDLMRGKDARHLVKDIATWYKSEYDRMLQIRAEGVQGRIEFVEW
jgi:hypothetical protein